MNLKVSSLLLPTVDGRPRYFPVPITALKPNIFVITSFKGVGTTLLKKTSDFGRLIGCPKLTRKYEEYSS